MGAAIGIILLLVVVAALAYFAVTAARSTKPKVGAPAPAAGVARPGAPVVDFHVKGDVAAVYFDVPLPEDADPVLNQLLVHEAIEVVREKRHSLPIDQVSRVVAYGKSGVEHAVAGEQSLETPGTLPPPAPPPVVFKQAGPDPLASFSGAPQGSPPGIAASVPEEGVGPAGADLQISAQLESGLRLQGVDPPAAEAGDVVLGLLRLGGYSVSAPAAKEGYESYVASNASGRTYICVDPLGSSDYPELSEQMISRFMVDFEQSGTDRGLLVSDKFGPFVVYEKERREPRVRFVTRERLQQFVDSLALG